MPFYIGNFASVSSYIIVTGNLPFTIAMSQWILPSTGSLPIEETTNQNKSLKIKSNLVFGEREKPEYTEKNHSVESIEPTNPTHLWRRGRNRTQYTFMEGEFSHHFANHSSQSQSLLKELLSHSYATPHRSLFQSLFSYSFLCGD